MTQANNALVEMSALMNSPAYQKHASPLGQQGSGANSQLLGIVVASPTKAAQHMDPVALAELSSFMGPTTGISSVMAAGGAVPGKTVAPVGLMRISPQTGYPV